MKNEELNKKLVEFAAAKWERLDRFIDEATQFHKEQAAKGLHNYGICQLCHRTHYFESEPNLNK